MTDSEIKRARYFVESDEDYINLLKKINKDLGDLVRLRDEQIATLTAERDALKQQRDELLAAAEQVCHANNLTEAQIAVRVLNTTIASVKEKQNAAD